MNRRPFEEALRAQKQKHRALRVAVERWAPAHKIDSIIEVTIEVGVDYYGDCLPDAQTTRAAHKRRLKRATTLGERLFPLLRDLAQSGDPTIDRCLGPILQLDYTRRDGLPRQTFHGFVEAIDELSLRLAFLAQALPDDPGGTRPARAFGLLVEKLARIYNIATTGRTPTTSKGEPFFRFVASVIDLLRAVDARFPKARFDLPPNDEALRKRVERAVGTPPRR